eukprot:SM000305S11815  [mRNA]  locus=s305:27780:32017:- [translate_table: standard]
MRDVGAVTLSAGSSARLPNCGLLEGSRGAMASALLSVVLALALTAYAPTVSAMAPVTLDESVPGLVTIGNGILNITLRRPQGQLVRIAYGPYSNLLNEPPTDNPMAQAAAVLVAKAALGDDPAASTADNQNYVGGAETDRAYYDMHWKKPGQVDDTYDSMSMTKYQVIDNSPERVIVSFTRSPSSKSTSSQAPLNVDIRYSMAAGSPGYHSYATLEHLASYAQVSISEFRAVMKLRAQSFTWAQLADDRGRVMPALADRLDKNSQATMVPEDRKLLKPQNPALTNEQEDKYHYLADIKDQLVYGWVTNDTVPVGLWSINPEKYEYMGGGPLKQDLTVQTGPFLLFYLHSQHVGTPGIYLPTGTPWAKVFGPFFVHVNQAGPTLQGGSGPNDLWGAAKLQAVYEFWSWPYRWAASAAYPIAGLRGTVSGKLVVDDPYLTTAVDLSKAWVSLANPGAAGSWAQEVYGYQYWTQPDITGTFTLTNVRPGTYNVYAYVPGVYGDYMYGIIFVSYGTELKLQRLVFSPPRAGPTLWEIGVPDRTAKEFFVPPMNPLSPYPYGATGDNRWRNYGSWLAYAATWPNDVTFNANTDSYATSWPYCQTVRAKGSNAYSPTTWTINFSLAAIPSPTSIYTMRMAFAGSHAAGIVVQVNGVSRPVFDTTQLAIARDNGMARATIHGYYESFDFTIAGSLLKAGPNSITLTQTRVFGPFIYVMYDYLRLEGPI